MQNETIVMRVSKAEKELVKKAAAELGQTITAYMKTGKCTKCGADGYEGIFKAIDWTCTCGKKHSWRAK